MNQPPTEQDWDDDQRRVIESAANSRIIVDAGPGTGKTAVACGRLAHLIDKQDVVPTNIWMICFTRAAVAEIQSRVHSYIGDRAYWITISTIDSRAWALNAGHRPKSELFGGYDVSIENALKLIKSSPAVQHELSEIKHLIIDEAQDIVGNRAELVEYLIAQLDCQCGVTVFADEAQAIYDFAMNDGDAFGAERTGIGQELLVGLRDSSKNKFTSDALRTIHRTSSPGLKRIFSIIRSHLLDSGKSNHNILQEVRDGISESADRNDLVWKNLDIFDQPQQNKHLVLFRTRAEALLAVQHRKTPLSTRISAYEPGLPAWLAICFHDYRSKSLKEEKFLSLLSERVPAIFSQANEPGLLWAKLAKIAGRPDGTVNMEMLRRKLGVKRPPVHLLQSEFGLPGPIFGTIHASKGREADHVTVMMPVIYNNSNRDNDFDEARIMFVGATRAKKTLWIGQSTRSNCKFVSSRRVYRWDLKRKNVSIEVGREDDITFESLVGRSTFGSEREAAEAQDHLAEIAYAIDTFDLVLETPSAPNYSLVVNRKNLIVGSVTGHLRNDIKNLILEEKGYYSKHYPIYLKNVRCWGCSTIVLPPDYDTSSIHAPWKNSGFILSPNICSFPSFPLT